LVKNPDVVCPIHAGDGGGTAGGLMMYVLYVQVMEGELPGD